MLKWDLFSFNFFRFSQTGMYVDFIIKQIVEYFMRSVFIYTSLFFGEKYIIEYLTKKTTDSFIINYNRLFSYNNFTYNNFFFTIVNFILYIIFFLFFVLFFL